MAAHPLFKPKNEVGSKGGAMKMANLARLHHSDYDALLRRFVVRRALVEVERVARARAGCVRAFWRFSRS
jgi:hypothetical protein